MTGAISVDASDPGTLYAAFRRTVAERRQIHGPGRQIYYPGRQ